MEEQVNISEAVKEIQSANEEEIKKIVTDWFEKTRTDGLRLGAYMISAAIYAAMKKHLGKAGKTSMRDYQRMTDDILKLIEVQLKTQQNDSVSDGIAEENTDDGSTEETN